MDPRCYNTCNICDWVRMRAEIESNLLTLGTFVLVLREGDRARRFDKRGDQIDKKPRQLTCSHRCSKTHLSHSHSML